MGFSTDLLDPVFRQALTADLTAYIQQKAQQTCILVRGGGLVIGGAICLSTLLPLAFYGNLVGTLATAGVLLCGAVIVLLVCRHISARTQAKIGAIRLEYYDGVILRG